MLTATRKPVAVAEGCDRARSGRKMGRLGVPGFTTAAPPNAAFVPRQRLHALLTATRKPVAAAEGCDRARSGRKMGRLGVSGFTTATPPNAAFVPRQRNFVHRQQSIPLRCKAFGAGQAMATIQGCDLRHVVFAQRQFARLKVAFKVGTLG